MSAAFNRREFLKLSTAAVSSATVMGTLQGLLTAKNVDASSSKLVTSDSDFIVPGVCLLCPSGCGVLTRVADGNVVKLEGNPMHPINLGALCPKGQAAPELLYNPDRLTGPVMRSGSRGSGEWEEISWDEAVQLVAQKFGELRETGHPERAVLMRLSVFFGSFTRNAAEQVAKAARIGFRST